MTTPAIIASNINQLNDLMEKHRELFEFQERLAVLEAELPRLSASNEQFRATNERLLSQIQQLNAQAEMHQLIVKTVQENPILQGIWEELLMTMKLTSDDIEAEFIRISKGLPRV